MNIQSPGAVSVIRVSKVSHGANATQTHTHVHTYIKFPELFLHRVYRLMSPGSTSFHLVKVSAFLPLESPVENLVVCYEPQFLLNVGDLSPGLINRRRAAMALNH